MSKTVADVLPIMRNVTGREDSSDPAFSDSVMIGYINDFYQLIMGQEVQLFDEEGWYEFNTIADQSVYPVNMNVNEATSIYRNVLLNPCYVDGFQAELTLSPQTFFAKWPETQTYQPTRPSYLLYYDNEITLRSPPDKEYLVKIMAYKVNHELTQQGSVIEQDYWWRYIAYGASIDLLNDYNESERVAEVMPAFMRYKNIMTARTMKQLSNQRTWPCF